MPHRAGVILGQIPHGTELNTGQCPGIVRGGMGGFGIDWYITSGIVLALYPLTSFAPLASKQTLVT